MQSQLLLNYSCDCMYICLKMIFKDLIVGLEIMPVVEHVPSIRDTGLAPSTTHVHERYEITIYYNLEKIREFLAFI